MVKCCGCCEKHIATSIVGLCLSFWELILASVYHFQTIGFAFSIIGIITSGLYLHLNLRDRKAKDQSPSPTNSTENEDGFADKT